MDPQIQEQHTQPRRSKRCCRNGESRNGSRSNSITPATIAAIGTAESERRSERSGRSGGTSRNKHRRKDSTSVSSSRSRGHGERGRRRGAESSASVPAGAGTSSTLNIRSRDATTSFRDPPIVDKKKKKQGKGKTKAVRRVVVEDSDDDEVVEDACALQSVRDAPKTIDTLPRIKQVVQESKDKPEVEHREAKRAREDAENETPSCGICFDEFTLQGILNCCAHVYCYSCIKEWSTKSNECPQCKRRFVSLAKVRTDGDVESNKQGKKRKLNEQQEHINRRDYGQSIREENHRQEIAINEQLSGMPGIEIRGFAGVPIFGYPVQRSTMLAGAVALRSHLAARSSSSFGPYTYRARGRVNTSAAAMSSSISRAQPHMIDQAHAAPPLFEPHESFSLEMFELQPPRSNGQTSRLARRSFTHQRYATDIADTVAARQARFNAQVAPDRSNEASSRAGHVSSASLRASNRAIEAFNASARAVAFPPHVPDSDDEVLGREEEEHDESEYVFALDSILARSGTLRAPQRDPHNLWYVSMENGAPADIFDRNNNNNNNNSFNNNNNDQVNNISINYADNNYNNNNNDQVNNSNINYANSNSNYNNNNNFNNNNNYDQVNSSNINYANNNNDQVNSSNIINGNNRALPRQTRQLTPPPVLGSPSTSASASAPSTRNNTTNNNYEVSSWWVAPLLPPAQPDESPVAVAAPGSNQVAQLPWASQALNIATSSTVNRPHSVSTGIDRPWTCTSCSFINRVGVYDCTICGAPHVIDLTQSHSYRLQQQPQQQQQQQPQPPPVSYTPPVQYSPFENQLPYMSSVHAGGSLSGADTSSYFGSPQHQQQQQTFERNQYPQSQQQHQQFGQEFQRQQQQEHQREQERRHQQYDQFQHRWQQLQQRQHNIFSSSSSSPTAWLCSSSWFCSNCSNTNVNSTHCVTCQAMPPPNRPMLADRPCYCAACNRAAGPPFY